MTTVLLVKTAKYPLRLTKDVVQHENLFATIIIVIMKTGQPRVKVVFG
jgi:hypothetical protein